MFSRILKVTRYTTLFFETRRPSSCSLQQENKKLVEISQKETQYNDSVVSTFFSNVQYASRLQYCNLKDFLKISTLRMIVINFR